MVGAQSLHEITAAGLNICVAILGHCISNYVSNYVSNYIRLNNNTVLSQADSCKLLLDSQYLHFAVDPYHLPGLPVWLFNALVGNVIQHRAWMYY